MTGVGKGTKVTGIVDVSAKPSVVSVAVKTAAPTVEDFTVKVTTPLALEVPGLPAMVSTPEARSETSVTVLPATGVPPAFFKVTVIVEKSKPSAQSEGSEAVIVETEPSTGVAVALTSAE